jgi:hypothetical protein
MLCQQTSAVHTDEASIRRAKAGRPGTQPGLGVALPIPI